MSFKEQDYIFVRAFVPFVAIVLLKAWKESFDAADMEVILSGMAPLNDEFAWLKKEASKWGVSLTNVAPQKANLDYYSFAHCLEDGSNTPEELRDTCQRWGNDGFREYFHALQSITEHHLEKASDDVRKRVEVAVLDILEHEVAFWNMSQGDT